MGPPRLSLAMALPLSVWQDHLTPWLSRVEAARLRGACKALREVMDECPVELGRVYAEDLNAALTCFPAAQSFEMVLEGWSPSVEEGEVVELLRRHGGTFKRITTFGLDAEELYAPAVRAGALPRLTHFKMTPSDPEHRQWLSDGRLRLLEEVHVDMEDAESVTALEHLRHLPHLRSLRLQVLRAPTAKAVFPAFIPPSLKILILDRLGAPLVESLLGQLPSMLRGSGAGLEEITIISAVKTRAKGGAALACVLQACSSTLKGLCLLSAYTSTCILHPDFASNVASGLVSCCERLERLEVPWGVFKCLPPTCPAFKRLTQLCLNNDAATIRLTSPVWARMARGLVPAIADLSLDVHRLSWEPPDGKEWVLPAGECLGGCCGHAQAADPPRPIPVRASSSSRGLPRAGRGDRQAAAPQLPVVGRVP
jgi:hypothetical protein